MNDAPELFLCGIMFAGLSVGMIYYWRLEVNTGFSAHRPYKSFCRYSSR